MDDKLKMNSLLDSTVCLKGYLTCNLERVTYELTLRLYPKKKNKKKNVTRSLLKLQMYMYVNIWCTKTPKSNQV